MSSHVASMMESSQLRVLYICRFIWERYNFIRNYNHAHEAYKYDLQVTYGQYHLFFFFLVAQDFWFLFLFVSWIRVLDDELAGCEGVLRSFNICVKVHSFTFLV
jgi:hypothetical protein